MLFTTPKWPVIACPDILGQSGQISQRQNIRKDNTSGNIASKGVSTRDFVNCAAIIAGDQHEINHAHQYKKCTPKGISPEQYLKLTTNCQYFRNQRNYDKYIITQEESNFPLAFSILTFEQVEQTERLLRAIYRPQNFYCIHVDLKAKEIIKKAFNSIAKCFDNVFLATKLIDVKWSEFPVLEAEINCMEDLVKYTSWKYFINLTGREFPIRTNSELVQALKAYNGSNDIDGTLHR